MTELAGSAQRHDIVMLRSPTLNDTTTVAVLGSFAVDGEYRVASIYKLY